MENSKLIIENLVHLLKKEKDAEWQQYQDALKNLTIQQREQNGICWYPLEIKESGYGLGDYPYLVVKRNKNAQLPHKFDGGKIVGIFSGHSNYKDEILKGTVHFVAGDTMKINFMVNDLPDWIDEGKIGVQLLFDETSYKEMDKALENLATTQRTRLAELREIIYGFKESAYNLNIDYHFNPALNDSQNLAIKSMLQTEDVALVHGPPGTGKTTTLVNGIKELLKKEKQVLVCAPSNSAADLLTERLAQLGVYVVRVGNISRIDQEILEHTVDEKITRHSDYKRIKEYKKQADEYRRMAHKYKRQFGYQEREQRRLLLKEAKNLAGEAVDMEYRLVDEVIDNAQAVVCTLVGSSSRFLEGRIYSTVIIDEAAQALEPACWVAMQKARKVIMAGDPFQLPPTVKSREAQKEGLNITLMEKTIGYLPQVTMLNIQYRMNATIMAYSNQYFYKGNLLAHDSVKDHTLKVPDARPLEFIDTAGCGFDEKMNQESRSYFNPEEATILFKHLDKLTDDLIEPTTIGIISPYREQVTYLKEYISLDKEFAYITVDTIDSFQGRECDVIYISMVRSNEQSEIGFLQDYRRMNVAITRARKKLILVGDSATLGNDDFYNNFIEFCQNDNAYQSAWEWINL